MSDSEFIKFAIAELEKIDDIDFALSEQNEYIDI